MTDQTLSPTIATEPVHEHSVGRAVWHFVRHYLEMVVAMFIGMFALGGLAGLVWPAMTTRADVGVMVMATNMSIGMAAWMRFRGHSWRGIAEMSASMYLPFAVLLVPYWAGMAGEGVLMTWGHLLMLPAMALAMLLRAADYAH
jgi:flagellar biosynthetic protein FliP